MVEKSMEKELNNSSLFKNTKYNNIITNNMKYAKLSSSISPNKVSPNRFQENVKINNNYYPENNQNNNIENINWLSKNGKFYLIITIYIKIINYLLIKTI